MFDHVGIVFEISNPAVPSTAAFLSKSASDYWKTIRRPTKPDGSCLAAELQRRRSSSWRLDVRFSGVHPVPLVAALRISPFEPHRAKR